MFEKRVVQAEWDLVPCDMVLEAGGYGAVLKIACRGYPNHDTWPEASASVRS